MMDRLEEMMELQDKLQRRYNNGRSPRDFMGELSPERWAYVKEMVLATENELHEALRETPWKSWSQSMHFDRDAFRDELVDAFHFFMNLLLSADITADEFFNAYLRKNNVNHGRIDDGYISTTG
jgi:dimeric dUTPase (all-alpha-NTP-PPase superfamily)